VLYHCTYISVRGKHKKMKRHFIIILLLSLNWVIFAQTDTTLIRLKTQEVKLTVDSITYFKNNLNNFNERPLVGKLIDPVVLNELGISLIASNKSPNVGLSIDFSPLFLRKLFTQVEIRSDFDQDLTFRGKFETRDLTRNFDFRICYEKYSIENSTLSDLNRVLIGSIYKTQSSAFGLSLGRDSYEKEIGCDISFRHTFHFGKPNNVTECSKMISAGGLVGLWDNKLNYNLGVGYLINFNYSCGIEYRKLYDFNEILITLRYVIHYG